jgi:hypothetical protein
VQVQGLPRQAPLGLVLHPLAGGEPVRGGAKADGTFALSDVPAGRYRVEIGQWGNPVRYSAGELDVAAPATTGVVLVPTPQ